MVTHGIWSMGTLCNGIIMQCSVEHACFDRKRIHKQAGLLYMEWVVSIVWCGKMMRANELNNAYHAKCHD